MGADGLLSNSNRVQCTIGLGLGVEGVSSDFRVEIDGVETRLSQLTTSEGRAVMGGPSGVKAKKTYCVQLMLLRHHLSFPRSNPSMRRGSERC